MNMGGSTHRLGRFGLDLTFSLSLGLGWIELRPISCANKTQSEKVDFAPGAATWQTG